MTATTPSEQRTADLFDAITPASTAPGALNLSREIAAAMSAALKECPYDRIEVAARMSRMLGREVTVSMLNAWTSESHQLHVPSLERAIAFDLATETHALARFYAAKLGASLLWDKDKLLTDLGRIQHARRELASAERAVNDALKHANGEGDGHRRIR